MYKSSRVVTLYDCDSLSIFHCSLIYVRSIFLQNVFLTVFSLKKCAIIFFSFPALLSVYHAMLCRAWSYAMVSRPSVYDISVSWSLYCSFEN